MHGSSRSRSLVAATIIIVMAVSITGLFGASGPTVRITSPASGAQVSGVIQIRASVTGSASTSYVIFGVDNTRPYSSNSMPYTFDLDTRGLLDGAHRIFAEVYDNYGLLASSNVVTIRVSNGLSSAVQARSEPAPTAPTRVAERPTPTPPARVAANAEPATAVAASGATSTQESERAATSSPTVAVRGPLPEPTRTTAQPEVSPATVSEVEAPLYASLPAGPTSTRPPVVTPTPPAATATPPPAATATPPMERVRGHTVVLNGRPVQFGVAPFIRNGRMQCEFRTLFEQVGATVSWEPETRTAHSVSEGLRVEIPIGSRIARVNGQPVDLGAAAIIMEGRTIVPVRFFASSTDCAVGWDSRTQVASLQTQTRMIAGRMAE